MASTTTSVSESSLFDTYTELCDQYETIILNWSDPTNEFRGYTNVRVCMYVCVCVCSIMNVCWMGFFGEVGEW